MNASVRISRWNLATSTAENQIHSVLNLIRRETRRNASPSVARRPDFVFWFSKQFSIYTPTKNV